MWLRSCRTYRPVSIVISAIALSVVSNSAAPSFASSFTSAGAITRAAAPSFLTSRLEVPDLGSFGFLHSMVRLLERERSRGRGKWSGWMATDWLRLQVATLGSSYRGAEVAATVIFSQQWLSPTLVAEGGHFSGGEAFSRVRVLTKSPYLDPSLIRGFSYSYQAAYAGLEWGGQTFALSVNVGVTRVENTYQRIPGAAASASNPQPVIQSSRSADVGPAGKLSLLIHL